LIAMHRLAPSSVPMPAATVTSTEGEFAGYVLERISGDTLQELIANGAIAEARRQLALVEETVAKLHGRGLYHGDINASNVIAADDGRTLLIDPVPHPGPGARLQDDLCLEEIRRQLEQAAGAAPGPAGAGPGLGS
jgi:RIO-like serine/threonine protein kinase